VYYEKRKEKDERRILRAEMGGLRKLAGVSRRQRSRMKTSDWI